MKKRLVVVVMTMILAFGMAACGTLEANAPAGNKADAEVYKIGVIQYAEHTALDEANKGFFAALSEMGMNYTADQQNAEGEKSACSAIAETLVSDGNDLIFAIGTPAAQAAAGATKEIPIVLTAVTDPEELGLVDTNKVPGGNITGTSDFTPVKQQMDLIKEIFPETKTVGILYCAEEPNSVLQADMAKKALKELGIIYADYTVSNAGDIKKTVKSAAGKVDVLYVPTDNLIAAHMDEAASVADEKEIPLICGEKGQVEAGGLFTYGIDYYQLGYMAGLQAIEILKNEAVPAEMPIGYLEVDKRALSVNEKTLEALEAKGMDLSVLRTKMAQK